jgi:hypothetical protein
LRSGHSPDRLNVELQSLVGPPLSQKGYRCVGFGPAGVTWRREMSAKLIVGLIVLGLLAIGGLGSGEVGSTVFGAVCAIAAALLVYLKRPATVAIRLSPVPGGTEMTLAGGRDARQIEPIARQVAGSEHAAVEPPAAAPEDLAEPIARLVSAARTRRARIAAAIARAELPYDEVATEVDGFVTAIERTARRAQLLYEALEDSPPDKVAGRLAEVRDDPARSELAAALSTQLRAQEHMQRQLDRFYDELERLLVELDTVRSQLVSVSASTEAAEQDSLADEVRALRERMGAVSEGMSVAYESRSD